MKDVGLLLIIRLINQYFFVDQDIYTIIYMDLQNPVYVMLNFNNSFKT